jgi:hypothetical protein
MPIYTYVVDHGIKSPSVGSNDIINGGKLQSVMFDDGLAKLQALEDFVKEIRDTTIDQQTKYAIDDFLN